MTQSHSSSLTNARKLQRQNKRRVRFCPEVVLVRDEDVVVPSTDSSSNDNNSDKDNISQLLWWSKGEIKSFEKSGAIYTKLTNRRQRAVLFGMLETAQSATQDLLASEERERQRRHDEEADDPAIMDNDNDDSLPAPEESSSSSIVVSASDAENWSSSCSDRRGLEHTIPQYHDKKRLFCRRAKRNETKARVIKIWRQQRSLRNSVDEERQQQQQRLLEEEIAKAYERDCLVDRIFARMLGHGDAVAVAGAAAEANSEQDDVVGTINKTIPVVPFRTIATAAATQSPTTKRRST